MYSNIILLTVSIIPLIGTFLILSISESNQSNYKMVTLFITCLTFLCSIFLWIFFDSKTSLFQFSLTLIWLPNFNLNYVMGIDGISLFFIMLTTFLILICILMSWNSMNNFSKEFFICFLMLEFCLIQVFCVLDILLFYIFFESTLIPMFLIIGIWGSSISKMSASYQFFLYTLIGSLLMLMSLIYMYTEKGTTDLQLLFHLTFLNNIQLFLWLAFFASFAVKIPMMPFHLWLPEAHAEAPTAGSVILAGVLLKIGGYGFLRFSIPLFPYASVFFTPLIFTLSLLAILYGSLTTLSQVDLKKIIAYSSIAHMGFVTLGIFSLNIQGLEGSMILMLSHGIVSSALFICVGILYDRYKTRILKYYSGMVQVMPIFTIFFMFFSFANTGFPGTSSFMGEFLILISLFHLNIYLTFFSTFGVILSASYSIWLFNSMSFGSLKIQYLKLFQDLSSREFFILLMLLIMVLWIGIFPYIFLNEMHFSVITILEQLY